MGESPAAQRSEQPGTQRLQGASSFRRGSAGREGGARARSLAAVSGTADGGETTARTDWHATASARQRGSVWWRL
ncbi:hypothetical protein Har1131_20905 [Haloarcula sp. CBA1131]|uniref:hypothetical protein n=1 Tax=Haloarcula sp. CBA1131 TaxID=1853686 RepID=UPI0012470B01|nr:hypothetical protein [Haloarcula sp. CBA1131]KAA9401064.1 hypothetical protein Har1131_20905 [Haloarcula sp. CBA1131]